MRKISGRWRGGVVFSVAAGLGATTPVSGQELKTGAIQVRRSVQSDPEVRAGVLPNGMRYFVRQAHLPVRGLSMRLGIDVGSFEERDDERGFAHFVEHLAFRTTRSAPDGGLDARFARLGVTFGRDQNAETSQFATTYRLDFNSAEELGTQEGFRWLRDVADGVLFRDPVIASEHGVVIAEQVASATEAMQVQQAIAKFQAPELRTTVRGPNGLSSKLSTIRKGALQAYYDRWYRPENAVLIVVGHQSTAELETMVRANFSSWQAKGPSPQRAPMGKLNMARGVDAMTLAAPSFPKLATACRLRPAPLRAADEISQTTRQIRQAVWQGIVNERFKQLVNSAKSGLLDASMVSSDNPESAVTCLIAMPIGDEWQRALAASQRELLRFGKDGPTDLELEAQVEEQRALLRGAVSNANARTATQLAEAMMERAIDRRPMLSPTEAFHAFNVAVEDVEPATIKAAFNADWAGSGPLLALTLPAQASAATLRTSWLDNNSAAALPAYSDQTAVTWPYGDFGKTGKVESREEIARPGFTRFRFSNGMILNFKHLTSEPNRVDVRAEFGGGRRQIANADFPAAMFGSGLFIQGGLGKSPMADIERAFRNVSWKFEFDIRNDSFQFSQSSISPNLPNMLQVFAAYLSDPGFRSDGDARIPEAIDMVFRSLATDPQLSVSEAIMTAIDPDNPELLPSQEKLGSLNSKEFARVLKAPIIGEAIELTIAGDVEEADAVRLVGNTLGALPNRKVDGQRTSDAHFLRFPNGTVPIIRASHQGAADKAAARLIWPLYVATPARRSEEYALQLVAAIFNERLRRRIRSELGKTYSPEVITDMPDDADQGYLAADFASTPSDIETLVAEARSLAKSLSVGEITSEEVEAVRQPKLNAFAAMREKNSWWAGAMSGSARRPESIDELMLYQSLMTSVTLADVKAAAAKWLKGPPIVGISLPKTRSQSPLRPVAGSPAAARANGNNKLRNIR